MALEIRTAAELIDPELEARWASRRAARQTEVLQHVLLAFAARPGPVEVEKIVGAFPDRAPESIREALARLDEEDLIQIRDSRIDLAYPFSAFPTPFIVQLPDGQERYACGEPLELGVDPAGPAPAAEGVMVWVGRRGDGQRRISTSL